GKASEAHARQHAAEVMEELHEARAAAAQPTSHRVPHPTRPRVVEADEQAALRARRRQLAARHAARCYLVEELGERPEDPGAAASWDRTAGRIERFREQFGITDAQSALGERPADRDARLVCMAARRTIDDV